MTALQETIAILSDRLAVEDIRQAEEDIRAGRTVDAESLCDVMLARHIATV